MDSSRAGMCGRAGINPRAITVGCSAGLGRPDRNRPVHLWPGGGGGRVVGIATAREYMCGRAGINSRAITVRCSAGLGRPDRNRPVHLWPGSGVGSGDSNRAGIYVWPRGNKSPRCYGRVFGKVGEAGP